ncbi:MAG: acylneuraminate cytidylyltransferase, partial [Candidatus Heimdallarchaeota archaeon]|nr:acylneuraminate cytidylyltransferase [Candidatus Heimdallarchaeota archaeon]
GAFTISKRDMLMLQKTRFSDSIKLCKISRKEEIDIDDHLDWRLAEAATNKKNIMFAVAGNKEIGTGHIYRVLTVMDDFAGHDLAVVTTTGNDLVVQKMKEIGVNVEVFKNLSELAESAKKYDLVINDILDTEKEYILSLKKHGCAVVNFEDLGHGALFADLVFNEIYESGYVSPPASNVYTGHQYYYGRAQFLHSSVKPFADEVKKVTILFGGTDENNLTAKTITAIYNKCQKHNIAINIILGLGYDHSVDKLMSEFPNISIINSVSNIAEVLFESDIIFSALGRTVYEISILAIPSIVMAQNDREMHHPFASSDRGFVNLGLGQKLKVDDISKAFMMLVDDYEFRKELYASMLEIRKTLLVGHKKVKEKINSLLHNIYTLNN